MILLDIDDTLYPKGKGPFVHVNSNIDKYVMGVCGIGADAVKSLRRTYISRYGSTLQGLMLHHGVDPTHYLETVHDVPVEEILAKDDRLHACLEQIEQPLVAFTNGSRTYACRVIAALGVDDIVRDMFTIEDMDFVPKPRPWGFIKVMRRYGMEAREFLLVDDSIANVETALSLGMRALLVGSDRPAGQAACIPSIYELTRVVHVK